MLERKPNMKFKRSLVAALVAVPLLAASQSSADPVDLGTAGDFVILAKSGVSTTGTTSVVGNIGISPIGATGFTGFGLVLDASNEFATSSLVTGKVFASDYAPPTPANLTTAVSDMETAYTDAAGRPADVTGLGAGNIGGMTLAPGVYKWGTGVTIPTDVTLSGGANDVWIFQIAGTLVVSSGRSVNLSGGAQIGNIFWQVAGQTTLGSTSRFKGTILDQTAIVLNTGARLDGRALAQTAVTLQSNAVVQSQTVSTTVDDIFVISDSNDPDNNVCVLGVVGGESQLYGNVYGRGTANQLVQISYDAPQITRVLRNDRKLKLGQKHFSTLEVFFDMVSATGAPVIVEKCSVQGSVDSVKRRGSTAVKCRTDTLFARLTQNQIASVEMAFAGNRNVKVKKKSLSIKCSGDVEDDS